MKQWNDDEGYSKMFLDGFNNTGILIPVSRERELKVGWAKRRMELQSPARDQQADIDSDEVESTAPSQNQVAADPVLPARNKPLTRVNETQLERLEALITEFSARTKKVIYNDGKLSAEDAGLRPTLQIEHDDDYRHGHIIRAGQPKASEQEWYKTAKKSATASESRAEHNVLDLFLQACDKIPGFRESSGRKRHPRKHKAIQVAPIAPIAYDGTEPPLRFEPALLEQAEILPSKLNNALILGSTGSGKTASFIQPALTAMLKYRVEDRAAAMLAIDPKVELLSSIKNTLAEIGETNRLVVVGECDPIQFFSEGDDLSLEDRFAIARRFVAGESRGEDSRWSAMADRLLVSLFKDSEAFGLVVGVGLLESIVWMMTGDDQYRNANEWVTIKKLLMLGMDGQQQIRYMSDLYDVLCSSVGLTNLDRPLARYAVLQQDHDQYFYNARGALLIADFLGGKDITSLLDMSVTRTKVERPLCSIGAAIERGAVIVFQPRQKPTHDIVGAALKSLFYRCVMERKDMLRPIGLICDEAQRFITADPETGEHSFLDRCRAYRVNAILATQSMAALEAVVNSEPGGRSALESILVNTPTKACFRTTDFSASHMMKSFIPADPSGQGHVLNARPLSSLKVGECYYSIGGTWGRSRYQLGAVQISNDATSNLQVQGELA